MSSVLKKTLAVVRFAREIGSFVFNFFFKSDFITGFILYYSMLEPSVTMGLILVMWTRENEKVNFFLF